MTGPDPDTRAPMAPADDAGIFLHPLARDRPDVSVGTYSHFADRQVTRDLPPYATATGNPARNVRARCDVAIVDRLLSLAWWDRGAAKVTRNLDAIRGADIALLETAR